MSESCITVLKYWTAINTKKHQKKKITSGLEITVKHVTPKGRERVEFFCPKRTSLFQFSVISDFSIGS